MRRAGPIRASPADLSSASAGRDGQIAASPYPDPKVAGSVNPDTQVAATPNLDTQVVGSRALQNACQRIQHLGDIRNGEKEMAHVDNV